MPKKIQKDRLSDPTGLQLSAKTPGKTALSKKRGAIACAIENHPDLLELFRLWPSLPAAIRRKVLELVEATGDGKGDEVLRQDAPGRI